MSGIGDFFEPVTDFLGFGTTDAQKAARDFAKKQGKLQDKQFKTLEQATAFASPNQPFTAGPLSIRGRNITGLDTFNRQDRNALNPFINQTTANINRISNLANDPSALNAFNERSNVLREGINTALGDFGNLTQGTLADLGGIRQDLASNNNPFIQARVDPLINSLASRRQQLQADINRRGVSGSFANQAVTNFDIEANRAIGNERATATSESLQAQLGTLGQIQATGGQLTEAQLQGFQLSSGLDKTQFDAASQQFNRQLSGFNATAQGQKDIFNARTSLVNGQFSRIMQTLGLSINTQNMLLSLASNLFTGAGSVAANLGQVSNVAQGQRIGLEQAQQTTGLGVISGLTGKNFTPTQGVL